MSADTLTALWHTLVGTITDVLPIAVIIFGFQLFVSAQADTAFRSRTGWLPVRPDRVGILS